MSRGWDGTGLHTCDVSIYLAIRVILCSSRLCLGPRVAACKLIKETGGGRARTFKELGMGELSSQPEALKQDSALPISLSLQYHS